MTLSPSGPFAGPGSNDEASVLLDDQMPSPSGSRRVGRSRNTCTGLPGVAGCTPDVIRHFAAQDYHGIDVEHQLDEVTHPVLVLASRDPDAGCGDPPEDPHELS
jgi:hypothetical protein